MNRSTIVVGVIAATALSGAIADQVKPHVAFRQGTFGLDANETHAASSLLGQVRTTAASWLWLHTDLYLHNGVEMRTRTAEEAKGGVRSQGSSDGVDDAIHGEQGVLTTIPDAERDFRGIFGDIERHMTAYQTMGGHEHTDPAKTLPLFRLMTWIDPAFIPGWTVGASLISRTKSDDNTALAISFLRNGLIDNPRSIAILSQLGSTVISDKRSLDEGVPYLERAITLHDGSLSSLSEDDVDGLQNAYRWLAMSYRDLGRPADLARVTQEGIKLFPKDGVLRRLQSGTSQGAQVEDHSQPAHDIDHHDH